MGRGSGGRGDGSVMQNIVVENFNFELFAIDDNAINNESRTRNSHGTFEGAIENFTATFTDSGGPDFDFFFDPVEIEKSTLDLTTRYLPSETVITLPGSTEQIVPSENDAGSPVFSDDDPYDQVVDENQPRIEFIITGDSLENKGIIEWTLLIEDLDPDPDEEGFQDAVEGNTFLTLEEAADKAINDINFIIEKNLLSQVTSARLTAPGFSDSDLEVNDEVSTEVTFEEFTFTNEILIEAEDLNLDTYHVEPIDIASGGKVISLLNASDHTGTASLNVGDLKIPPGTYDLTLSVFDENDGDAQLEVLFNDKTVEAAGNPIILSEHTTSGFPTEDVRREFVIEGIEITDSSDILSIVGTADDDPRGGEWARVDFLTFTQSEVS